jgi:predicted HTH transcriptional regulator
MLFKDRLEVWNPGHLPFGMTIAKLKGPHTSIPTNPLLAEPMYLAGYIERMGTGTGDIVRLCAGHNLKEPEFRQEEEFITTIWRRVGNKVGNKVGNGLTENQTIILEAIRQNPKMSAADLSSVVGIPTRKVEDNIAKLRERGMLQRIGGTRGY